MERAIKIEIKPQEIIQAVRMKKRALADMSNVET